MSRDAALRVGVLSYPMLFQARGGLQIQVLESVAALRALGVEARLLDPAREKLADFDLIHVFAAINGNHRLVEYARAFELPVVLSPLIRPFWTRSLGWRARLIENIAYRLSGGEVRTEYRQIASALGCADRLIALGERERQSIVESFRIPAERVRVIGNGIPDRFFAAEHSLFVERTGIARGFVLNVAAINPHKNQLGLARALAPLQVPLVVIGQCLPGDADYLRALQAQPNVRYLGPVEYDDPLLAAAYAAAGVFCLPSHDEVMPLTTLEALAADTPVVMTRHHAMDLSRLGGLIAEVAPQDEAAIRTVVARALESPPAAGRCREAAREYSWREVGRRIKAVYEELV